MRLLAATRRAAGAAALAAGAAMACAPCAASSVQVCDAPKAMTAEQDDVLLRFAAVVKARLDDSGRRVALIARSGIDLSRLGGVRYSHAGVALKGPADLPWAVRELYYACDEKRPRLYDEGMAGFLLGTDDPHTSWVSLVLLPPAASAGLERAALDKRRALALLGATYSANAYPFSTLYQNCNQWVAELLAGAWSEAEGDTGPRDARVDAQRWLADQGYAPAVFETSLPPLMWAVHLVPWLHSDDHPAAELAQDRYSVSMPSSIEAFVHARVPGATRLELCHAGRHVVIHRGWSAVAEGCVAGPGDEVTELARD